MKDRVAGAPGQYSATVDSSQLQKLQTGEPFVITLKRNDQPIVEGTPYSKAAVLPDSLAVRLCPELEDPSPADAFAALADHGVVSQGRKDGWFFRQWANGMAECWIKFDNAEDLWAYDIALPFPIKSLIFNANLVVINSDAPNNMITEDYFCVQRYNYYTDSETGETTEYVESVTCGVETRNNVALNIHVVGEWKDIVNSGGGSYPIWEGGLY